MVQPKVILAQLEQRLKQHNQRLRQTLGQELPRSSSQSLLLERIKNRKNQLRSSAREIEQRLTWFGISLWIGKSLIRGWVKSKKLF